MPRPPFPSRFKKIVSDVRASPLGYIRKIKLAPELRIRAMAVCPEFRQTAVPVVVVAGSLLQGSHLPAVMSRRRRLPATRIPAGVGKLHRFLEF